MSVSPLPIRQNTEAAPDRTFAPCPAWCSTHQTNLAGRNHSGKLTSFFAETADSGKRVSIGIWVERRDDGEGNVKDFGILDMKSLEEVELTVVTMYQLSKALENLVYSTASGKPSRNRMEDIGPARTDGGHNRVVPDSPGMFAKRLLELLERDGRSYRTLGAAVHADPSYVHHIAHGKRPVPGPQLVAALDKTLSAEGELIRIANIEQPPVDARRRA